MIPNMTHGIMKRNMHELTRNNRDNLIVVIHFEISFFDYFLYFISRLDCKFFLGIEEYEIFDIKS